MNYTQAMQALKAAGTAQNRKVYARHGVSGPCFGVSYAIQDKLAKQIGRDQPLAEKLWTSGNHDARILATKIAEPARCGAALLDAWVKNVNCYVLGDALAGLTSTTPTAWGRMKKWTRARGEWVSSTGWNVLASLAVHQAELDNAELAARLAEIERRIATSPNRVRHSMNQALIAIGARGGQLAKQALAAAGRIGKVEVDHGATGCKTPDATGYIRRTRAHRAKQATNKNARKGRT